MRIFGYSNTDIPVFNGMECAIVIADSEEEAKQILENSKNLHGIDTSKVFEIPFKKGFTLIGAYIE